LVASVLAPAGFAGTAEASDTPPAFGLSSAAFDDGGELPAKYSCQGEGVSPPLRWKGVPKGTKALALVLDDPDAPAGTFVHWVLADFKPKPRSIPEDGQPKKAFGGVNSTGRPGYAPPCPPRGPAHRYVFTLYALEKAAKLPPGATAATLVDAIEDTTLAETRLTGLYARN
jgi:Raf kinase inhibitor-like YbhB/YbcL family protein